MGIARAALILMLGNLASRLLGVVREQVIAGLFGASGVVDAFTAAARVPTALYDLLVGGMISAALVPVFSDYAEEDRELWRLASSVINALLLLLLMVVAILILLAPQLIWLFGYGFAAGTREMAIGLLRLMMPALFFMALAGILTALLYSRQNFLIPALCPALYNLSIVVAALLLQGSLGVTSLVLGVLLGALLQCGVQLWGLRGMLYSPRILLFHPGVRRILKLYAPVALGMVVSAVGVAIDSNLASRTGEGNMAAMRFATTLIQFPLGLVAGAVSFAVLPTLSRHSVPAAEAAATRTSAGDEGLVTMGQEASFVEKPPWPSSPSLVSGSSLAMETEAQGRLASYKATLSLGLRLVLLAILPATLGLVLLRFPLIQLLFQHGVFDAEDSWRTSLAFLAYSPGLPAAALDQLLIFAFYARKDTLTPVLVGIAAVLVYLVVALILIQPLGMPGLALANSAQWVFHAIVMFFLLTRAIGSLKGLGLGATSLKALLASLVMAALLALAGPLLSSLVPTEGSLSLGIYIALLGSLGVSLYALCLFLLKVEEVRQTWSLVRARLMG